MSHPDKSDSQGSEPIGAGLARTIEDVESRVSEGFQSLARQIHKRMSGEQQGRTWPTENPPSEDPSVKEKIAGYVATADNTIGDNVKKVAKAAHDAMSSGRH